MKPFIPYSLLAAAALCGVAFGQTATTTPVGYTTQTLAANQFNLVGLTLHGSTASGGAITTVDADSVSAAAGTFNQLEEGRTYILEINNGEGEGIIQEVSTWTADSVTTPQDLTAFNVDAGDSFSLRVAPTLEEVFGTEDSALTKGFNAGAADVVWVPTGPGTYDRYFLHSTNVWRSAQSGNNTPDVPLIYTDGLLIEKKGASAELVISGEVKLDSTVTAVNQGFNVVSVIYPVGTTLQNLGLEDDLAAGFNAGAADIVWAPAEGGAYTRYFRHTTGAWRNAATGADVAGDVELPSAILIERKGDAVNVDLTPPASYASL